jgi:hypothetical protein
MDRSRLNISSKALRLVQRARREPCGGQPGAGERCDIFARAESKERTFGEWIAGVLGLWNVVEIHQVKKMIEGTKKGLMLEVHHVDALREYAEATQDDLSRLAKRIMEQATFL